MSAHPDWLHLYPLADGRRVSVIERDDGTALIWIERPWKNNPHRYTRDRSTASQIVASFVLADTFARAMVDAVAAISP